MREISFVKKNEVKWKTFESFLSGQLQLSPDELASYYTDIVDDLSYAKTFFPKSSIVPYLNKLSSKAHHKVYKTKKEDRSRFKTFWTEEIPLAIRESHKALSVSLLVFLISIAIGAISTMIDSDFSRVILGDYYVDMTIDNIEEGDPMAVYKGEEESMMTYGIGSNNIRVGLTSYVLGIVGPIFSGWILFKNGIMVGAFQTFFLEYDLLWTTFTAIFIHGALELSAIVIFAGAGLVIGNSWWFPGTYSRIDSFVAGAKRSIKVVIAGLPVIVVAAFLESYLTRHYQILGPWGGMAVIVPSFLYIYWYFVWYPKHVTKKLQAHG